MAWFGDKSYDRAQLLTRARDAASRGSHRKAIALYERVREVEPDNEDILRRIAAVRLRAGQREEAWRDCQLASRRMTRKGFVDQAIGVLREFAEKFPRQREVWEELAELELERERPPDAVGVLVEGQRWFRSRRTRSDAISLLRRARKIDPTHFEANFLLADRVARSGAPAPARRILEQLDRQPRTRGERRRLRWRLFRLTPTPVAGWAWIRAIFEAAA